MASTHKPLNIFEPIKVPDTASYLPFNAKETDKVAPQCGKTSYRISKAPKDNQYHVIRTVQANNKANPQRA